MLVLPTSQENFGRVLFEALGCGLAVFVPNHVDTWPELRSLGAFHIDQTKESIADEVGRYASLPLEERRAEVLRRAHAASKFLSRERLIAAYSDLYSQGSRRS